MGDKEKETMDRRKFLIGAGSLAAGGAAAMGSGAFASVSADRNINVEVAGDAGAYLGLESTSAYASQNGKKLQLEFDGSNTQDGDGLNADADTQFRNVFKVVNQGTNAIRFQLYDGGFNKLTGTPLLVAVSDSTIEYSEINDVTAVNTSNSPGTISGGDPAVADAQDIEPGETSYVHIGFFLNDSNEALGHSNTNVSDVPDSLTVYAGAGAEDGTL